MSAIKKMGFGLASVILFSLSTMSNAAILLYEEPDAVNPTNPSNYPITRTFTDDSATLVYGSLSVTCRLSLTGSVDETSPGVGEVRVTSGSVTTGPNGNIFVCPFISLNGFPWISDPVVEADLMPDGSDEGNVRMTFNNVGVNLCGSGLTVETDFNNNSHTKFASRSGFSFVNEELVGSSPACFFTADLRSNVGEDIHVVRTP